MTVNYDKIYVKAHPPRFPYSPHAKQRQLKDLWPSEQEKFKRIVDAALSTKPQGGK